MVLNGLSPATNYLQQDILNLFASNMINMKVYDAMYMLCLNIKLHYVSLFK